VFANLVVFVVGGAVFGCVEELGGVENVLDWSGGHHSGDHSGKHAVGGSVACRCHPLHLSWSCSLWWFAARKIWIFRFHRIGIDIMFRTGTKNLKRRKSVIFLLY